MEITADKITFGGKSIGQINGKNVFLPYAIPGETYDIEITDSKRDYDEGLIKSIVKKSEHRVEPPCPYYGKCGGCNMMHIDSEYQRKLRLGILTDIFAQNNIDITGLTKIVQGPDLNYRARFQLNNGGLSQKSSNNIIPVEKCLCAENVINDYLSSTPFENRGKGRVHLFGSDFVVRNGQGDSKLAISTESSYNENKGKQKRIIGKGKTKNLKLKENRYFQGTVASPENNITVKINNQELTFDVRGFFQSNLFVFEKVIKLITELLPGGNNILDMYAGCGSISTFLADKYKNTVLVEHNRDAIVYAEQNMVGKPHVSYGLSGANWVKTCASYCGQFDACVVDPPRSGMEKEVCDYLCKSKIPLILSLSCDPSTQARDCAKLIKNGYKLKKMYLLDFYPNTSHIESLGVFEL